MAYQPLLQILTFSVPYRVQPLAAVVLVLGTVKGGHCSMAHDYQLPREWKNTSVDKTWLSVQAKCQKQQLKEWLLLANPKSGLTYAT